MNENLHLSDCKFCGHPTESHHVKCAKLKGVTVSTPKPLEQLKPLGEPTEIEEDLLDISPNV